MVSCQGSSLMEEFGSTLAPSGRVFPHLSTVSHQLAITITDGMIMSKLNRCTLAVSRHETKSGVL